MLKAYKCTNSAGLGIIIFAHSPGQAKSFALSRDEFEFCEFIEIESTREPKADKYWKLAIGNALEFASHPKIYRSLGWFSEGLSSTCKKCGLYEYGDLPQSIIDESTGLCKECAST